MVVKFLADNPGLVTAVMTILGSVVGVLVSNRGKANLIRELEEAKAATVKAAKNAAPVLDLAFNVGIGKVPLNEDTLKTLSAGASVAWIDTKNLSKEVEDVLDQFAVEKGVLKP